MENEVVLHCHPWNACCFVTVPRDLGGLLLFCWCYSFEPCDGGECPFNCAVTFPSLLGSSSAFQRHPCLVFLCSASNCSWYLLCLLDDKPIKSIWNMAVCCNSALCSASFCWNFAGTPSGCSGALLLRMFCLLGWSCWLWLVLSGLPLDLEAAQCHTKMTFSLFIKPCKSSLVLVFPRVCNWRFQSSKKLIIIFPSYTASFHSPIEGKKWLTSNRDTKDVMGSCFSKAFSFLTLSIRSLLCSVHF